MELSRRDFVVLAAGALATAEFRRLAFGAETGVIPDATKYGDLFEQRIWTTGSQAFDARLLCSTDRFVVLARIEGAVEALPVADLSSEDKALLRPFINSPVNHDIIRFYEGGSARLDLPNSSTRFYRMPGPLESNFPLRNVITQLHAVLPEDERPQLCILGNVGVLAMNAVPGVHEKIGHLLPMLQLRPAPAPTSQVGSNPEAKRLLGELSREVAVNFSGVPVGTAVDALRKLCPIEIVLHPDNEKSPVDIIPLGFPPQRLRLDALLSKLAGYVACRWNLTLDGKQIVIGGGEETQTLGFKASYPIPGLLAENAIGLFEFVTADTGKGRMDVASFNNNNQAVTVKAHPTVHRELSELLYQVGQAIRDIQPNAAGPTKNRPRRN